MTTRVCVCLCTFKRPQLIDTLNSIDAQQLPENVTLTLSIADNDAAGSGRAIVEQFRQQSDMEVHYEIQPEKNISCARNTTVKNAQGDWLVFVDDDEFAEPDWIAKLLECAEQHQADVVLGKVVIHYPKHTPQWILDGDYFHKHTPVTGTVVTVGSTCNALVRASCLPDPQAPFDLNYGITGGGDTHFFSRIHRSGGRIVTCREAVVSETVEDDRLNRDYLIRKATRIGETYAMIFFCKLSPLAKALQFSRAGVQAGVAGLFALLLTPFGSKRSFKYEMVMRSNWGKVRFFMNTPPVEIYK
ncbi:glycosyltransferase family 2 protein [uncultured Ferrimonas sp.]|uniref:glycosyltransferase family 2 protein n=1 Tax=uncultured Ferrimonas sp. TaxID=432640 RepID=UPI00262227B9|nr:glycosyltransferase family 2 protein [uncultured Ferrimonas sp.]